MSRLDKEYNALASMGYKGSMDDMRYKYRRDFPQQYNTRWDFLKRENYPGTIDDKEYLFWRAKAPTVNFLFDGSRELDPRITFSRSTPAWYWKNGVLVEAGIDEPVFEDGGLRLEPQATNYTINSEGEFYDQLRNVDVTYLEDGLAEVYRYTEEEQESGTRRTIIAPHDLQYFAVDGEVATFALDMKPVDAVSASIATQINGARAVSFLFEDPSQHSYGANADAPPLFNFNYTPLPDGFIRVSVSGQYISEDDHTRHFNAPAGGLTGYSHFGSTILVRRPQLVAGGLATSYIPTHGTPVTRAADQFQWTGSSFDRAFNPSQGAFIFKIGERSGLPVTGAINPYYGAALWTESGSLTTPSAGGIYFNSSNDGFFRGIGVKAPNEGRINGAINFHIYPGDTAGLSWQGETISLFVNGTLAGSFTHPDVVGALQAVTRFHVHDAQHMYLERMTMFRTRPTDAQMEALTYA